MAKTSDIVAILEWAERKATFKGNPKKGPRRPKMSDKEFDPVEYLTKERAKLERFEKYWKDQEKLAKKDEKKPESKGLKLGGLEWFIIGVLMYPFVGQIYQAMLAVPK